MFDHTINIDTVFEFIEFYFDIRSIQSQHAYKSYNTEF